jgi:hypothetical protein
MVPTAADLLACYRLGDAATGLRLPPQTHDTGSVRFGMCGALNIRRTAGVDSADDQWHLVAVTIMRKPDGIRHAQ